MAVLIQINVVLALVGILFCCFSSSLPLTSTKPLKAAAKVIPPGEDEIKSEVKKLKGSDMGSDDEVLKTFFAAFKLIQKEEVLRLEGGSDGLVNCSKLEEEGMENVDVSIRELVRGLCQKLKLQPTVTYLLGSDEDQQKDLRARRALGREVLCPWTFSLDTHPYRLPEKIYKAECQMDQCGRCKRLGGTCKPVQYPLQVLTPRKNEYTATGAFIYDKSLKLVPVACMCYLPEADDSTKVTSEPISTSTYQN